MNTCGGCAYFIPAPVDQSKVAGMPKHGLCSGNPPAVMLLPMQGHAPGSRVQLNNAVQGLALQSIRPMVLESDMQCDLWRSANKT